MIAPLILVFSIICFGAFWILYRSYPLKLIKAELATRGLFYPTAIRQLFTGIYFTELCLAGLFFLVRDAGGKASCTTQAAIMIVVTVLTAFFYYSLDHSHIRYWFSLQWLFKQQSGSKYKERPDLRCRGELSAAKPRIL